LGRKARKGRGERKEGGKEEGGHAWNIKFGDDANTALIPILHDISDVFVRVNSL
jgi:hypothetical protein